MQRTIVWLAVLTAAFLGARPASAQAREPSAPPPAAPAPAAPAPLTHRSQVGLRLGASLPFVFAIKYGDGPECSEDTGETFCRRFAPPMLDLDLGFGLSDGLELTVGGRIGLSDDDVSSTHPLALSAGLRTYASAASVFKPYFGARLELDITRSEVPQWRDLDFGLRGEVGLALDPVKYFGFYLQVGESIRVLRALSFITDVTFGVQVRVP